MNALAALEGLGLFVGSTTPAHDDLVSAPPTDVTLHFSDAIDPTSVQAGDLLVNAIAADSFNLDDSDSVTFHFNSSPVAVEGLQTMSLAADSILRQSDGDGVAAMTRTFFYDPTPLQVTAITPSSGSTLVLPDPTLVVDFNEPIAPGSVGVDDLELSAGRVASAILLDPDSVQYQLADLVSEQDLTVTLAAGAVRDAVGQPGQAFAASFGTDIASLIFPEPFIQVPPLGSMMHESSLTGEIHEFADSDRFELSLQAGQVLSIAIDQAATLASTITIRNPSNVVIGTASGPLAESITLSTGPLVDSGVYEVTVAGDGLTTGLYDMQVVVGGHHESESHGGSDNGTQATAQNLAAGWSNLDPSARLVAARGWLSNNSDVDWYEVTLLNSQPTSFSLTGSQSSNLVMTLHAADGTQVAAATVADNVDQQIADFVASADQSFYVRVTGDATDYALVAAGGAAFGLEFTNPIVAQDIDATLGVIGHVGSGVVSLGSANASETVATTGDSDSTGDLDSTGESDSTGDLGSSGSSALAELSLPQGWLDSAVIRGRGDVIEVIAGDPIDVRSLVAATEITDNHISINSAPEGDLPRDAIFTADGSRILIANRTSGNVLVYDAATRVVVADIAVGGQPVNLALSPDGRYALTANTASDTVSVIDLSTLTLAHEIPVSGSWPYRVKVTPDGQQAIVATSDRFVVVSMTSFAETNSFASPDLGMVSFAVTSSRALPISVGYADFAITPNSQKLVVPDAGFSASELRLRLYDIASGSEIAALQLPGRGTAVTISADGSSAYVATTPRVSVGIHSITKIDLNLDAISAILPTETLSTHRILLTPDEQHAIVQGHNQLLFIDLADGSTSFADPYYASDFGFSFDGKYVFTANQRLIDVASQSLVSAPPSIGGQNVVALSPTSYRAATTNFTFADDFAVFNIDGLNTALEATQPSGSAPEGDSPIAIAITPDGQTVVTANYGSSNASIIDLATGSVLAWVDTNAEPDDVAITPDGNYALLSSPEDESLVILDLATRSIAATLGGLTTDPRHILISGDGSTAYVSTTGDPDGLDRVYFVDLSGAGSTVGGSLVIGDIGNETTGYAEMALSPDGSLLAVPASRDSQVVLIDTATRTEISRLPTGGFPKRLVFSSDDARLYTADRDSGTITVIGINGVGSVVEGTIPGLSGIDSIILDHADRYLYVTTGIYGDIVAIDTASHQIVRTIQLDQNVSPGDLQLVGNVLYVEASVGLPVELPLRMNRASVLRVLADGPSSILVDETPLSSWTRGIVYNPSLQSLVALTYAVDGIDVLSFDAIATGDEDAYQFIPQDGDEVIISAQTPRDEAGPTQNHLSLGFELFDANGNFLQRSTGGVLSHTITSLGAHTIRVFATHLSQGEYYLTIDGVTDPPGPSIVAISPPDNASDVPLDADLVVTFNEPVAKGSGDISIMRTDDDTLFRTIDVTSAEVNVNNDVVVIDPAIAWELNTGYYVLISPGAIEDRSGNTFAGIADKTLWDFRVGFGHDFGDAPAPYPVTLAEGGARHQVSSGPFLGTAGDSEFDGVHSSLADADDLAGSNDDEDGVSFGTIAVGSLDATATVIIQNAGSSAKLDAWIDFNHDGNWGGPHEQIADSVSVIDGSNAILFDVPSWAVSGQTFARFRVSSAGDLGFIGDADDGEVEDHALTIAPPAASSPFFGGPDVVHTGGDGISIFPADLNNDGHIDLVSARGTNQYLAWLENDGTGGFTERPLSNDRFAWGVTAANIDGDGDIDVVSVSLSSRHVVWHENIGFGAFNSHPIDTALPSAAEVMTGDMDGDGDIDVIAMAQYSDPIAWYENDGNQSFTKHVVVTGISAESLDVADLDGDGDLDFVSDAGGISWYENIGGSFTTRTVTTNSAYRAAAADVDRDGDMDVLAATHNGVYWYDNDGTQTFTRRTIGPSYQTRSMTSADVDGDGDLDVIVAPFQDYESVGWYENDGNQVFTLRYLATGLSGTKGIVAADVDGDRDLDILTTQQVSDTITLFKNQNGVPPMLVDLNPADDSAVVATDTNLQIAFDEPVVKGAGEIQIRRVADDTLVETIDVSSAAVTINSSEVTIDPAGSLDYLTEYYVLIGSKVFADVGGNEFYGIHDVITVELHHSPAGDRLRRRAGYLHRKRSRQLSHHRCRRRRQPYDRGRLVHGLHG